jgi:hypothetical protein
VRQQMTADAIVLLVAGLIVFWVSIVALVRHHASRHPMNRAAQRARETRG